MDKTAGNMSNIRNDQINLAIADYAVRGMLDGDGFREFRKEDYARANVVRANTKRFIQAVFEFLGYSECITQPDCPWAQPSELLDWMVHRVDSQLHCDIPLTSPWMRDAFMNEFIETWREPVAEVVCILENLIEDSGYLADVLRTYGIE